MIYRQSAARGKRSSGQVESKSWTFLSRCAYDLLPHISTHTHDSLFCHWLPANLSGAQVKLPLHPRSPLSCHCLRQYIMKFTHLQMLALFWLASLSPAVPSPWLHSTLSPPCCCCCAAWNMLARMLTSVNHSPGTCRAVRVAGSTREKWREQGLRGVAGVFVGGLLLYVIVFHKI